MPIERPLASLPSGIMQALQIAMQMKNVQQQRQQQAIENERNAKLDTLRQQETAQRMEQSRKDQQYQDADRSLKAHQAIAGMIDEGGKAVDSTGMVQDTTSLPSLSGTPSRYGGNASLPLDYHRDADQTRTLDFKDFGVPTSVEMATPQRRAQVTHDAAIAKANTENEVAKSRRIPLPSELRYPGGPVDVDPKELDSTITALVKLHPNPTYHAPHYERDDAGNVTAISQNADGTYKTDKVGRVGHTSSAARGVSAQDKADKAFDVSLNPDRQKVNKIETRISAREGLKNQTKATIDGYEKELAVIRGTDRKKNKTAWDKLPEVQRNLTASTSLLEKLETEQQNDVKLKQDIFDSVEAKKKKYFGTRMAAAEEPDDEDEDEPDETDEMDEEAKASAANAAAAANPGLDSTRRYMQEHGISTPPPAGAPYSPQVPYVNAPPPAPVPYAPGQVPRAAPQSAAPAAQPAAPVAVAWGPNPFRKKAKGK